MWAIALLSLLTLTVPAQQAAALPASAPGFANPIIPGDHPDPSIIRVGDVYWTASTSGDWSPQFALYKSTDLQHWEPAGAVFPRQPSWATGSFWAPELVNDRGHILVYYVARKRDGPLCVAAANASRPEGPYKDAGPMICQADGSIDPAFARDEHGKPYLLWKEDGNSAAQPTPIWAQPLTRNLLHLRGKKTQLIVNDPASWEGNVVEAPYVLRRAGYFYLFYAGNACCGVQCNYAEGVARARNLLGPWERDPANPILRPNAVWRCPGHGSAVESPAGLDYFVYHAYPVDGAIYLGRESVLDPIAWQPDGWPEINHGQGPGTTAPQTQAAILRDDFSGKTLDQLWRWPVNQTPSTSVRDQKLTLTVSNGEDRGILARSPNAANYAAEISVTSTAGALGSLAVIGNPAHMAGLGLEGDNLELWTLDGGQRHSLWRGTAPATSSLHLKVVSSNNGTNLAFSYSDGSQWQPAGEAIDTTKLPQWDQGLRVGLTVDGKPGSRAAFEHFVLRPAPADAAK